MARSAAETRRHILRTAYGLFHRRGFARVGIDDVAEQTGFTKRTLYNHFRSKDELLAAVLELHGDLALHRIRDFALPIGAARDLIASLFEELARWATKPGWSGPGFTRLVMEIADLPGHPARAIARRHKAAVEAWLTDELARRNDRSPAAHAREVMVLLEGAMVLMLIHGERHYAADAAKAAARLIATRAR